MNTERIQPLTDRAAAPYLFNRAAFRHKKKRSHAPIDAVVCDILDLSDDRPAKADEYSWLTAMVTAMPDEQVAEKMRSYKNSFIDIDDAVVEKVIFEAL